MRNKGITLVALIITIIILLILVGVSIMAITNADLFLKAETSKEKSLDAQNTENNILEDYNNKIETIISGSRSSANVEFIAHGIGSEKSLKSYTYNATKSGKLIITLFSCKGDGGSPGTTFYCKKNDEELDFVNVPNDSYRIMKCYIVDVVSGDVVTLGVNSTGYWGDNGYSIFFCE